MWIDEAGNPIPYDRTTKYERAAEASTYTIASHALKIHESLTEFKEKFRVEAVRLYNLFVAENGQIGKGKGGVTIYNFDRSIKIVVKVQEPITFDENTIELAKNKLDELFSYGLDGAKDFIKPIAMEAFHTTSGKLDTKRVLGLKKHAIRIKEPKEKADYMAAMDLIDKAIRRPSSKEYYQVWVKDQHGEYQDIQLNFASI